MSVKYPNYVNLTFSSEEQPNEKISSPPHRKKSLSPPQAPSKFISSKSTHCTSSSSPSESPTPTQVVPPPKLCFVIPIKLEPQELPLPQISLNDPYVQTMDNWPPGPSNQPPPLRSVHLLVIECIMSIMVQITTTTRFKDAGKKIYLEINRYNQSWAYEDFMAGLEAQEPKKQLKDRVMQGTRTIPYSQGNQKDRSTRNDPILIEMHLGFRVTLECDLLVEDGPHDGHQREETRMTRGVSPSALSCSWNAPRTIACTSVMFVALPFRQIKELFRRRVATSLALAGLS
uniref:Uncharacterized protein n=1 Tax=Tanacetum cinerariifolium TaxID=118510 RepID=A0A6L2M957_TANCI|nr:hypothetical protein [Tanacetum cinerariifolium]